MACYDFKCTACGVCETFTTREPEPGHYVGDARCSGEWKRIWSFGIVWPADQRGH